MFKNVSRRLLGNIGTIYIQFPTISKFNDFSTFIGSFETGQSSKSELVIGTFVIFKLLFHFWKKLCTGKDSRLFLI